MHNYSEDMATQQPTRILTQARPMSPQDGKSAGKKNKKRLANASPYAQGTGEIATNTDISITPVHPEHADNKYIVISRF